LQFSHEAGLYLRGFELEITAPEGVDIFYTFSSSGNTGEDNVLSGVNFNVTTFMHPFLSRHEGGVSPLAMNRNNLGRWSYTGGLDSRAKQLNPGEKIVVNLPRVRTAFTVSVVTRENGVLSEPVTRTFIRGPGGADVQYWADNEFLVFALYSDAMNLYDQDLGIFGAGQDRLDWIDEYSRLGGKSRADVLEDMNDHRTQGNFPPTLPAGFTKRGRAAEIPVNVEIFDPHRNSTRVNQRAGMRVKGGWSRGTFVNEQKTFEFYCRSTYGDRGNFLFPLFGDLNTLKYGDEAGNIIIRFERFRIRNGGTDREQTYLRDELGQTLAEVSGFANTQQHRPAVVFLNGAYYGLVWMKTPRTENHWDRVYG